MSRAPLETTQRRLVGALAAGLAAVLTLAGCSSGQDTQTDSVLPSVNGATGQSGPIAIRNAVIAYPSDGVYPSGGTAQLSLTIINTGSQADELVDASSPVAEVRIDGDTALTARRTILVGTPGVSVDPRPTSSAVTTTPTPTSGATPTGGSVPGSPTSTSGPVSSAPGSVSSAPGSVSSAPTTSSSTSVSAPPSVEIGKATIVLTGLREALMSGKTYTVTFVFRTAGSITLQLPIAAPTTARPEPTGGETPH